MTVWQSVFAFLIPRTFMYFRTQFYSWDFWWVRCKFPCRDKGIVSCSLNICEPIILCEAAPLLKRSLVHNDFLYRDKLNIVGSAWYWLGRANFNIVLSIEKEHFATVFFQLTSTPSFLLPLMQNRFCGLLWWSWSLCLLGALLQQTLSGMSSRQ